MKVQDINTSVELLQSLLWQHNNAPKLTSIIRSKEEWYTSQFSEFWDAWVRDVFDLRTANEFGLKVWSIILGLPLVLTEPAPTKLVNFGFGDTNKNFDHGNFGISGSDVAAVTEDEARLMLRLRYFQLICRPTVPEINTFLQQLFRGKGTVYCKDTLNMAYVIYTFDFDPGSNILNMLAYYDLLPRPAGVGVFVESQGRPAFGFGDYNRNFNHGTFLR